MNRLNRRPSPQTMAYDAKRFVSDIKGLINISRAPLDKEFKLKSLYLPVAQDALSSRIGDLL